MSDSQKITGKTLLELGYKPGPWFASAVAEAEAARLEGAEESVIGGIISRHAPITPTLLPMRAVGAKAYSESIEPEGIDEIENVRSVRAHMDELMRVPTIVAGAIMPDACPSGSAPGTVPVGGIAAAREAIHPGMHSADICCSMAVTMFEPTDPIAILDAGMLLSHFGGGGRPRGKQVQPPHEIMTAFAMSPFLRQIQSAAIEHFATQGDGNHFFYVGRVASTGKIALVTHHGSRGPGAMLYKLGMAAAEKHRQKISPETPKHNAWIPSETREGEDYWSALQTIRAWTKASHFAIHDMIVKHLGIRPVDRFWNEHNFVFRKSDGLFYHAKGATPAWAGFADDSDGRTLIPLNMASPVLIAAGLDNPRALGFAPHGAGRNFSRTAYMKRHSGKTEERMMREQTVGIDARFFCGIPDVSELPLAYKNAVAVRRQIESFGLAKVVDTIEPIGSIMAGDWQRDAPWMVNRRAKQAARAAAEAGGV